jgi:hypothetical protein
MSENNKKDVTLTDDEFEFERNAEDETTLRMLQIKLRDKEELEEREATFCVATDLGRIQATLHHERQSRLLRLVFLKRVKEQKLYRKSYGIKTWAGFCNAVGIKAHTIDQELAQMGVFAEEFLASLANLGWTPSEAKALARAVKVENDTPSQLASSSQFPEIDLDGKTYRLDAEHKDEILEAVATVLDRSRKEVKKTANELAEAQKEHEAESKEYRKQIKDLKALVVDPSIPEHFQQIFKQIEGKVNEIIILGNRLNFKRTYGDADDELVVKRNLLVSVNIMENQFNALLSSLREALIER